MPESDTTRVGEHVALAIVVGLAAAVMFASHRAGHWWGDDWALYLRQAEALLDGTPRRVLDQNEFTVTMSLGAGFSPALYPWGFPLLLAPFVAVLGSDVDRLAVVPVLGASAFSVAWYLLARRRLGAGAALLGGPVVALSPLVLGWTELIQSELPFMAAAAWSLVLLDRLTATDRLLGPAARMLGMIGLGLSAVASFSVRREGLAVLAAIGAAQVAALAAGRQRPDRRAVGLLLVPHVTFATTAWLLQVVLPTTVIPSTSGASPVNLWRFRRRHAEHLFELVGLKRPWEEDPTVFGNAALGWTAGTVFLVLATTGAVLALRRRRDAHLVGYAAAALAIGGSSRVLLNRYVCTVGPLLLLLALMGLGSVLAMVGLDRTAPRLRGLRTTSALGVAALVAILVGNAGNAHLRIDQASAAADAGTIEWGPTHPDAIAMFDEVTARTGPDDVIGAPKARAMTFATGRLAVQVDEYRPVPGIRLALIVAERSSPVATDLLDDPCHDLVWSNARFELFRPCP